MRSIIIVLSSEDHESAISFHLLCLLFLADLQAWALSARVDELDADWTHECAGCIFQVLFAGVTWVRSLLLIMEFLRLNHSSVLQLNDIFKKCLFRFGNILEIVIALHETDSLFFLFLVIEWNLSHDLNFKVIEYEFD